MKDNNKTDGRVVLTELHREATEAYMAYAMSVLLGRALPDVRDGLKPVHRRILLVLSFRDFFCLGISELKCFFYWRFSSFFDFFVNS